MIGLMRKENFKNLTLTDHIEGKRNSKIVSNMLDKSVQIKSITKRKRGHKADSTAENNKK